MDTKERIRQLEEAHRTEIDRLVEEYSKAFDAAIQAGTIVPDAAQDRFRLSWLPARPCGPIADSVLKMLSAKTGMVARWNGCDKCPIRLSPKPKAPAPAVTKEQLFTLLKGLSGAFVAMKTDKEPSDENLQQLATVIYDQYYSARAPVNLPMIGGIGGCPVADDDDGLGCHHNAPSFRPGMYKF